MARANKNQKLAEQVTMLNLLPYFRTHPQATLMEAADDLAMTPQQLREYLRRLHLCGPGMLPDELIDLDVSWTGVKILDDQGMAHALRLTRVEAGALLMALQSLLAVPGLVDSRALESAAHKLASRLGGSHADLGGWDFGHVPGEAAEADTAPTPEAPAADAAVETIRRAMEAGTTVSFEYAGATQPREVSAARLFRTGGHTYLHAFDASKGEHRTFRLDRMRKVVQGSTPADPRMAQSHFDPEDAFNFSRVSDHVVLEVAADSGWLIDDLLTDAVEREGDHLVVTLALVQPEWIVRFVLSHADRVRLVQPASLARAIAQRAQVGLNAYDVAK